MMASPIEDLATCPDYPFKTWESYYPALFKRVTMCDYSVVPSYDDYITAYESHGDTTDVDIVKGLLDAGADPQKGFNLLLEYCIIRQNYKLFYCDYFSTILQTFFDKGVQLDINILIKLYVAEVPEDFEYEVRTCRNRARLIEALYPFVPDLFVRLDKAIHWDTIEEYVHSTGYGTEDDYIENEFTTMEELREGIYSNIKGHCIGLMGRWAI